MDLSKLLSLIEEMPAYRRLVDELEKKGDTSRAAVLDAAKPYLIAALHQRLTVPMLIVTSQPESSRKLYEQLLAWCPSIDIKLFPEPESLPYEFVATDTSSEMERLQALAALANIGGDDNASTKGSPVIIASAAAFMQKVTPFSEFTSAAHTIKQDMEVEPFQLLGRLQAMGYVAEDMVELPGTVSHRGGIIDIYPSTGARPVRLEFWGNTIDNIRFFDPVSQRSVKEVSSITIAPATELLTPFINDNRAEVEATLNSLDLTGLDSEMKELFESFKEGLLNKERPENVQFCTPLFQSDSLLNYLSFPEGLLILDELRNIKLAVEDFEAKADNQRAEKIIRKELPPNFPLPHFIWDELDSVIKNKRSLSLTSFGVTDTEKWHELNFTPAHSYAGQLPVFVKKAGEALGQGERLILVSHQASRLAELLDQAEIIATPLTEIKEVPPPGSLTLLQGLLAEGWVMNGGQACLLTDAEIFGFMKQRRLLKKRPVPHHKLFIDMKPGEYVVHIEHGIARFAGVAKMNAGNGEGEKEYLVLEYAAGDRLYLPADQIDRASRYVGARGQTPVLIRLGSQEWSRTKKRVKDSVADIAEELIDLYAAREVVPGFRFSEDTVWQQEVEASFPYVETPDQLEVQRQVKEDMENTKPMDRLVCGDVGYGKTEVAIRAAFKAVMDNKQVAVLVPTTVLAEQHLSAFKDRLSAFPVRIEALSRFRTHREQQEVVKGLADGSVDICIGTHRIIQKDIKFKDLGLLIIDEEQRFGVAHKE
ncbi:MAG: DEAD/DEAH box helicase, partial [Chloroflexota bacterium]